MSRSVILFLGLGSLALFCTFCLIFHAPGIEKSLLTQSRDTLSAKNMNWAVENVVIDGRDISLHGFAPSKEASQQAYRFVSNIEGVRTVDNQLKIRESSSIVEANPVVPDPYKLSMELSEENRLITLQGFVPDKESQQTLVRAAEEYVPAENVVDKLQIAPGAPGAWTKVAKVSLESLQKLQSGFVLLENQEILISGIAVSQRIEEDITLSFTKSVPDTFSLTKDIDVAAQIDAEDCQEELNELLVNNNIQFQTSSATISPASFSLLDQILDVTKRCPEVKIEIGGHTDSRGSEKSNLALSQRRTDSVLEYLTSKGISQERLRAKGYGESNPIAENSTPEGQAKNRRIEFKVQEGNY